jgi:Arm DNA-binding domain
VGRLSATSVKANKVPGRYGDGDGLFLLIGPSGSKSWMVRVQKDGRRRDFGLGSEKKLSLAMARKLAAELRGHGRAGFLLIKTSLSRSRSVPTAQKSAPRTCSGQSVRWRKWTSRWTEELGTEDLAP